MNKNAILWNINYIDKQLNINVKILFRNCFWRRETNSIPITLWKTVTCFFIVIVDWKWLRLANREILGSNPMQGKRFTHLARCQLKNTCTVFIRYVVSYSLGPGTLGEDTLLDYKSKPIYYQQILFSHKVSTKLSKDIMIHNNIS